MANHRRSWCIQPTKTSLIGIIRLLLVGAVTPTPSRTTAFLPHLKVLQQESVVSPRFMHRFSTLKNGNFYGPSFIIPPHLTTKHKSKSSSTPLQMSYVADSTDYSGADDNPLDDTSSSDSKDDDFGGSSGDGSSRDMADVPTIEEQPVPDSKNSGCRFVALYYDKHVDAGVEMGAKGEEELVKRTMDVMHEMRVELLEDHILWARKANLYNETFNFESMADVVWSYPLLSGDQRYQIGHAICIDSNTHHHALELLSREPILRSLVRSPHDTDDDVTAKLLQPGFIPFYKWRHVKDHTLRMDEGRSGTPTLIVGMDRVDDAVEGVRKENNVSHVEYLIDSERVVMAGPLLPATSTSTSNDNNKNEDDAIGSLMVVNMPNRTAAIEFAENDPCALAGLYGSLRVHAFNHLDVSGKYVLKNLFVDDPDDERDLVQEALEYWGYPVENRQTPWINS